MPPTVNVKSDDITIKAWREAAAKSVIDHFGNQLPNLRLLCFFVDVDCSYLYFILLFFLFFLFLLFSPLWG